MCVLQGRGERNEGAETVFERKALLILVIYFITVFLVPRTAPGTSQVLS